MDRHPLRPTPRITTIIARWWVPAVVVLALLTGGWLFVAGLRVKYLNACLTFQFAAKALATGHDLYASHAPSTRPQYVYPPLFAFIFIPLSHLTMANVTRVWLVFSVILTVLALVLGTVEMMRRFQVPRSARMVAGLCGGAFLLSSGEIKTEWGTGQTDMLILLAFVLALRWMERLPFLAGAVLGFAGNIKYQTLVALPWMLLRRRWRAAAAVVLSSLGFALVPALATGWEENLRNLGIAFAGLAGFLGIHHHVAPPMVDIAWGRSISITSAVARLLEIIHGNPARAMAVGGMVALGFLGVVAWIYRAYGFRLFTVHTDSPAQVPGAGGVMAIEWIGLMVAWLAFGPEVSRRHMCVLLLLHAAVLALLASPENRFRRRPLVIGLIVWQVGLRLPPSGLPFLQKSADIWNGIGGPSWCLLFLYACLVRSGLEWAKGRGEAEISKGLPVQPVGSLASSPP